MVRYQVRLLLRRERFAVAVRRRKLMLQLALVERPLAKGRRLEMCRRAVADAVHRRRPLRRT